MGPLSLTMNVTFTLICMIFFVVEELKGGEKKLRAARCSALVIDENVVALALRRFSH